MLSHSLVVIRSIVAGPPTLPLARAQEPLHAATMENAASRFGQHLAHTEKKYRDRALKKLTVYLTKKTEWTELEWDKLWKALFYCMWMSDKRPVQEELSTNLAALVHKVPSSEAALQFVHSFFRTMHREWHGLDGLRMDKFYSLVRKFVRETVALLRVQDWDEDLLQTFVSVLSAEVVSQLPNGLRMHLADLYLTEIYNAAGKDVTTDAFVTLMEPFFTLLSGEYDKIVFKRVRELVFEDMLTKYKFGPQPEKESEKDETDDEEDAEEEDKVFEQVDVAQVQHRIFAIASADDTAERNRSALYTLYKKFFTVTHVDSFQAAQEEAANPTKKAKKEKKQKEVVESAVTDKAEDSPKVEETDEKKKTKKSKKRKAKKEADTEPETEKKTEVEAEKKTETSAKTDDVVKEETVKTPAKKKTNKQKVATETKTEDVDMTPAETEKSTEKKQKKQKKEEKKSKQEEKKPKQEKKIVEKAPVELVKEKSPAKEQAKLKQEKVEKKESYTTVTKSGKKFKRCGSCGGFGKGLVPKDKNLCGHCERTQKTQKKKTVSASKKRKAESQAQAAREELEKAESGKKVTFGKSKALRHEVSVKRLRASAKRDAVSKDSEDIKGVLKVKSPTPASKKAKKKTKSTKGRKTAADFF
ncbi:hypothetical protein PF005_g17723 [Phytophthora fragariae]|uniref:Ribosomal RNA processing protein 1 n=1 Tax=Phytophthora fragariae TaxID=53985 RepID=A0A6A3JID1_9STRA|nr:hypothetical protein PF009_g16745 [Phytophthora fragariae]KAE8993892.1 hypothetical protein PF011_g16954 [Phytophthora fragariae]KAE9094278.1 hypothetical protein PF007_g17816 [Phytophthora fragariae]KAE9124127.1 hypothetical protein PF006_g17264 [Phytophthora fragariae]KAE9194359.1 hypothetical protein PF005_g17723 [Phytophthora fragariae]